MRGIAFHMGAGATAGISRGGCCRTQTSKAMTAALRERANRYATDHPRLDGKRLSLCPTKFGSESLSLPASRRLVDITGVHFSGCQTKPPQRMGDYRLLTPRRRQGRRVQK